MFHSSNPELSAASFCLGDPHCYLGDDTVVINNIKAGKWKELRVQNRTKKL